MRALYTWLIRCAVPFAFLIVLWRGIGDRGYRQGLGERLGLGPRLSRRSLWLHAVSLGEMTAAAPLLRALRARYPDIPLIVSTATPAGRARAQNLLGHDADIRFLPYDTPGAVRRFLARTQPRAAIIMETELWPNLLRECERFGTPVLLASARLSAKSVSNYRRFGKLFSGVFTPNLTVAAQTDSDAERFRSIGAADAQLSVVGNVKFDLELDDGIAAAGQALRAAYGDAPGDTHRAARPIWIAGSTHAGEEDQLLDAQAFLKTSHPDAMLLLVPRHKDRFDSVAELLMRRSVAFARRSHMAGAAAPMPMPTPMPLPADVSVLLVDTVGELALLYASADIAFVGGSLVPIGGHNLLEPAALGLPVLTGPSYSNSKEIARLLLARGAALQVNSSAELAALLKRLIEDPAERHRIGLIGQEIIAANRGSVEKLLALIDLRLS
jgi:3-deoxy-D-manno-octulosonic-acid transferase